MAHPKRPRRQKKADRLLHSGATREQIRVDFAIAPMDAMALDMDRKWGIDRLVTLVPTDMAAKYGAAMAHLNASIEANDPEACVAAAANVMKGMVALDAAATASGATPATGEFWEYCLEVDGGEDFHFAVMQDNTEWRTVQHQRPGLRMFSMREIALALKAYCDVVPLGEVKDAFPAAQVIAVTPADRPNYAAGGDPIPL